MLLSDPTYRRFSEKFVELKQTHASCEEKIRVLREQVFLAEREENMTKQDLNAFAAEVQESKDNLVEESRKVATQDVMRSRVETMLEFHRGEWDLEDVDEAIKIFNETYLEDAINPNGGVWRRRCPQGFSCKRYQKQW